MSFWVLVIAAIAWFFLVPPKEKPQAVLSLPVAQPAASSAAHGVQCLQSLRKQLAADEKLTPELKAAFNSIAAAFKDGGAA